MVIIIIIIKIIIIIIIIICSANTVSKIEIVNKLAVTIEKTETTANKTNVRHFSHL